MERGTRRDNRLLQLDPLEGAARLRGQQRQYLRVLVAEDIAARPAGQQQAAHQGAAAPERGDQELS